MKTILLIVLLILFVSCGGGGSSTNGGNSNGLPPDNTGPLEIPSLPLKSESLQASVNGTDSVFVGYDDTGSTALVQLMKYEIKNNIPVNPKLAVPHELLNAEEFNSEEMAKIGPFDISLGLLRSDSKEDGKILYDLGINLKGPTVTTDTRPNFVLTYCIDVSGSMNDRTGNSKLSTKSKIELVKADLISVVHQLKPGDIMNVILFSTTASMYIENYQPGYSDEDLLLYQIHGIKAEGNTNIEAGLEMAYGFASGYYNANKKNRVLLITDAMANAGSTDATLIAQKVIINNKEGILMSGIGIGFDYDAAFLEELTDAGAGNQFLVATDADAENIFSIGLLPLLMLTAKDMKVEIVYPNTISHISSAAEQIASSAEELKGINFSYNSSQYYLERFKTDLTTAVTESEITINITYLDPITKEKNKASKTFKIGDFLENESSNIKDALTMIYLTSLIKGSKSWEDIKWEFNHVLKHHQSEMFSEYKTFLYQFANVPEEDVDEF